MSIESKVESAVEKEKRIKESGVALVKNIIEAYRNQLQLVVDFNQELPEGQRAFARNQLEKLGSLLDAKETIIDSRAYMPYANSQGLSDVWKSKIYGYEVVFSSPDADTEPTSSGLYVDMDGYVHISVGDGWSSVVGSDTQKHALESQGMKDFFVSNVLNIVQAGHVFHGASLPNMVRI